jgi:transcriptional regulator with XRE-family HTH domain
MTSLATEKPLTNLFTQECRKWRQFRKLSQLDLALEANISQRHLSYLETGRSRPSRDMVIQLCHAMDIPLRERNGLLQAAGYSALYKESGLDEPTMEPVMKAVKRVLDHHNPLPAIVVDRFWDVQMTNTSADRLLALIGSMSDVFSPDSLQRKLNIAEITLHPEGLRKFITNWEQSAPLFVNRLRSEIASSVDEQVQERLEKYIALAAPLYEQNNLEQSLLPVMPLDINIGGITLSLFSMMSTVGTPQDITADELRIESFYPNDEATELFFNHQQMQS